MRVWQVATLLVVAALVGAGGGYLVGVTVPGSRSLETSGASTTTSTTCVVSAEGQILLQVVNSTSGKPIPSAQVQGELTPIPCGSNPVKTITLNATRTNSTGYALFGAELGEYHLTLYTYGNYFVDASTLPEKTTCVTLGIPSGEAVIKYSGTFQFTC